MGEESANSPALRVVRCCPGVVEYHQNEGVPTRMCAINPRGVFRRPCLHGHGTLRKVSDGDSTSFSRRASSGECGWRRGKRSLRLESTKSGDSEFARYPRDEAPQQRHRGAESDRCVDAEQEVDSGVLQHGRRKGVSWQWGPLDSFDEVKRALLESTAVYKPNYEHQLICMTDSNQN